MKTWATTLDNLTEKPTQPVLMLKQTPVAMHLVGADFLELRAHPHVFDGLFSDAPKSSAKHHAHPEMTREVLKQIPAALADPIAIFKEDQRPNTYVFMLEVTDAKGNTVIAPVTFSATGRHAEINLMKTAFGRDKKLWFPLQEQQGLLLYANSKKIQRWNESSGTNRLRGSNAVSDSIVLNEDDLRKAKEQYPDLYQAEGNGFHQPLSSRYPTAMRKEEDADSEMLYADYETAKKDEAFMEKNAPLLKSIPGLASKKRKPETIAEESIERLKANLLFLYDLVPETKRQRAKLWYDGGRRMSEKWAERYGIAPQTSAAVIAVLSPQKGWFENVSMGERILDAIFTKRDYVWDEAMTKKANTIADKPEIKDERGRAEGKTLGELLANHDYIAAAIWIRCYDQAHNDSAYKILSPEGGAQDYARTDSGKKAALRWQNYGVIAKAISCIEDPRLANISLQLGLKHKVRNFYNNLAHPGLENFATIDTHAVADATLIPLSAADQIVDQNFGGKGTKKSAASGLSGTYPYFFEAYKRAATERGVLPREMQSITWEAIRAIYTDRFKTKDNKNAIIDIWKAVDQGKMSVEEAQSKVVEMAGGLKRFAWEDKAYNEAVGDTYDRASVDALIEVESGAINFEVAPDPNDKELTARWNALPKEEKVRISATVANEIVPKVLAEFEAEGTLTEQIGGYLGETNPSFVLDVVKWPQAMPIAKMLGFVLNQDSMMVTTEKPEVGTNKTGAIVITLPEGYSYSQIEKLYKKLYELKGAKGEALCGGFSARGNTMTLLNFTGKPDEWLADKIKTVVTDFAVSTETKNVGFPDRKEGDYNYEGDSRASILRGQATQSLHRELNITGKRRVSASLRQSPRADDARDLGEQQGDTGSGRGSDSQSASTLARSGGGAQDGRDSGSSGRLRQEATSDNPAGYTDREIDQFLLETDWTNLPQGVIDRIEQDYLDALRNEDQRGSERARRNTLTPKEKIHAIGTRGFGALRRNRGLSFENGSKQSQRSQSVYRKRRSMDVPSKGLLGGVPGDTSGIERRRAGGSRGQVSSVLTPVSVWDPGAKVSNILQGFQNLKGRDLSSASPSFEEYAPTIEAAEQFLSSLKSAKETLGPAGACVEEKSIEELTGQDEWHSQCRIFLSEDRQCGFVIKNGDDLVSVFSAKGHNSGDAIVECAISAGARRLDCFNTILPGFYALHGFRPVARLTFNREYAPYDWEYNFYQKYNNGEPNVVFMVYDNSRESPFFKNAEVDGNATLPYTDGEAYGEPYLSEGVAKYAEVNKAVDEAVAEANDPDKVAQSSSQYRGAYSPMNASDSNKFNGGLIELMESADKSTFLHESAHAWLDADTGLALALAQKHRNGEELTDGERAFVQNLGAFLRWGQEEGVISLGVTQELDSIFSGLEAWSQMTIEQQRGMHELFAEGFESYLMGGEAPKPSLIPLFRQFAYWLRGIYAQVAKQPHPISPEVKKLYDQLFVGEQEASDAEVRAGMAKMFDESDKDFMTPEEQAQYDRLAHEASLETQGIVSRALSGVMRSFARLREKTAASIRSQFGEEIAKVEKELLKEPRHIAYKILTTGYSDADGNVISAKLNRQAFLDAGFDKKTADSLTRRGLMSRDGQLTPLQLSEFAGFESPVDMVGELLETRDANREATEIVGAKVRQEHGMGIEAYSALEADLAAHNATRSRVLTIEYNVVARKLGKRQLLVGAAREYALSKIGNMQVDAITPSIYQRDESRCAKEAEKAFRKGDYDRCLEMKRGQILNHELARAALEVKSMVSKGERRAKRAMRSKTIHPAYLQLLVYLARRHGINGKSAVKEVSGMTALQIATQLGEDGTPVDGVTPGADGATSFFSDTRFNEMTADDARAYFDALRLIEKLGRDRLTYEKEGVKMRIADLVEEGVDTIERNAQARGQEPIPFEKQRVPLSQMDKVKDRIQRFFYAHVKIATWCRIFDGNNFGFFWANFINPANKCADFEEDQRAIVAEKIYNILSPIFPKKGKGMYDIDKMRIGNRMMSKGERFAAALNMGNASNMQRLMGGEPEFWTAETIAQLQRSLTVQEWEAIQKIWDIFEEYRPLIAEKEKRVYGVEPEWIPIEEVEVLTKAGRSIKLKGGYYPVVYDPRASNIVDKQNDATAAEEMMRGAYQSATTRRSFTKSRVAEVYDRPLRLDLSALYGGVNDVIHDLAWHEWLIQTKRLLDGVNGDGSGLRDTIKEYYGYHVAKAFDEWREAIAVGTRVDMDNDVRSAMKWVSGNVGLASMGFSLTSALVQITGLGYVIPRVGASNTLAALREYLNNRKGLRMAINQRSTLMRNRAINMNKQINHIRNVLEKGRENWLQKYGYSMLLAVQGVVDTISWQAAYRKALSEGFDENVAISMADQVVIDTQSSGRLNDLASVERSTALEPFTVFYSWMNAAFNMSYAVHKGEANKAKRWAQLMYMGILMPTVEGILRECFKVEGDDDDDKDDEKGAIDYLVLKPMASSLEYHLGFFVFTREVANAAGNALQGEHVWKYGGPAGVRGLATATDLVGATGDPVSWHALNTFIDLTGVFGVPSAQIKRTIKGIRAIEQDKVEGLDALKAPIFGYSGKLKN